MKSLYSSIRTPSPFFKVDERMVWIKISGLPLCAWGSNAYKKVASLFGKFKFFEDEESTVMSLGRVCISTRSQKQVSETIKVEVNGEIFDVNVHEIGTWNININDNTSDSSSHLDVNHLDKKDISIEDNLDDDLDDLNGMLNDLGQATKKEETHEEFTNVSESSDLSRPPGFENTKRSSSNTSKCSTNFARHHKEDIKESKMTRLELFRLKSMWGNINLDYACSMARGRSGGLISMWDPNMFSKDTIWCDDYFIIVKGQWNNAVGDCFMINIYGPQDSSGLIDLPIGGITEDIPDIKIMAIDRMWSDHSPILLHVKKANFGPSHFKFYNTWLNRDGFDDLIKSMWASMDTSNENRNIRSHEKLIGLKTAIKKWQADVRKNDTSKKHGILSEIKDIEKKINDGSASTFDHEKRIKLLQDIDKLDNLEALDLIQKAHIKWDIEGDENSKFFHGMINNKRRSQAIFRSLPQGANSSFFKLIPKISNPISIKDFCPILLIGIHYKIIAKILANRLSKVIDKVVSKEQSTFISGHQILDGPLIISEIIQWYKKRKKKMLIFKVDFEKAFDSVSWKYLDFVLHSLHFASKWRSWITASLHSSRASILINGNPTSEFSIKRGLRQGDPLSPFLFILVMEGLHCVMSNAVSSGLIRGIKLGSSDITLSYLFYADNVVITTDWNSCDIDNIIQVLHVFYLASGLRINIHKSNLYGIGVSNDEISSLASRTGCATGSFPFTYLGLSIGANMNLTSSWSVLIDRFQKRLSSWKANLLSIGGRLTLIKASQVLPSFDKGGLNISSLKAFNLALLQKWRWRMFSSPNTLLVNTIKALHGQDGGLDNKRADIGIQDMAYLRELLMEISQIDLSVDEDTCTWSLADDGIFSVRSSRRLIDSKLLPSILSSTSWDNILPHKVNIFLWRLSLDRFPHRLNLLSRGIEIPTISCSSCNGNVESADHIFFACDLVKEVWSLVRKWCDLSIPPFASYDAWKSWICSLHAPKASQLKPRVESSSCKALTWWNSQIHTQSREVAVGMAWEDFKTLTMEEFCPINEIQKLETEFWNHAMLGAGHAAYTDRFHELAMRVPIERRDERPEQPRVVYALILDINYFRHFIDILENYNPMDDEPMRDADRVVAPTPGSAITIPETANKLAIKEAYDGEINLGNEENMLSDEFALKLWLDCEERFGKKIIKKELIVALRGEIYFVKFIINPKQDDVDPCVIFGRSFMRLTKGIVDFGNETITIYPELDPFWEDSDESQKSVDD
ncbi:RNA-directed DNA polymerase, eukaryota, reverse transcriptase zinc-binding domain protein [Tanacetum coccineum]